MKCGIMAKGFDVREKKTWKKKLEKIMFLCSFMMMATVTIKNFVGFSRVKFEGGGGSGDDSSCIKIV